jgi:hypothetical protein
MVLKAREKVFLGVALLVGVVMGFDTFVTRPKNKELQALRAQLIEASEKMTALTTQMAGLRAVKKRVEEKRKEKEFVSGRIADARQLSILLDQMGKESQKKQIEITQLTINYDAVNPADEKAKLSSGSIKKVSLESGLMAAYGAIGPYLDGIQSLPIFLEVERVDISRKEGMFPKLQLNIQQVLYMSRTIGEPGKGDGKEIKPAF